MHLRLNEQSDLFGMEGVRNIPEKFKEAMTLSVKAQWKVW